MTGAAATPSQTQDTCSTQRSSSSTTLKRKTVATLSYDSSDDATSDDDGGFLIKPKEMPYASGHPFEMIRNFEVPDHFYPIGDVEQIESLQLELNETRTR